jgi:hypothetical protein
MLATGMRRRLPAHLWPLAGLGLGGAADFGAYCLLGVPPYHWYYVGSTVALGLTGVFGLALLLRQPRPVGSLRCVQRVAWIGGPVVTALLLAALAVVSFGGREVPWTHPVLFGNWALPKEYEDIGAAVADRVGDATVVAPPEIGTVAYACDCSMVDIFSDPGRALPLIDQRIREAGPGMRILLEANFARLDRTRRPRPATYRLIWTQGPVPAGAPAWPTNSSWTRPAVIYLEPTR